jgi:hypothetical protein
MLGDIPERGGFTLVLLPRDDKLENLVLSFSLCQRAGSSTAPYVLKRPGIYSMQYR